VFFLKGAAGSHCDGKTVFLCKKRSFLLLLMYKSKNDLTNEINVLDINSLVVITGNNSILINNTVV
jgi:hypothetical protein